MNQTTTTTTHCQICGRDIKANTGYIAHHGYKRPGYGYQTNGCFGAQELPYEVSNGAIGRHITQVKNYIKGQQEKEVELLANPPATIIVYAKYSYGTDETYEKPDDFDSSKYYPYTGYGSAFGRELRQTRRNIKEMTAELEYAQERFDNWVKVA